MRLGMMKMEMKMERYKGDDATPPGIETDMIYLGIALKYYYFIYSYSYLA